MNRKVKWGILGTADIGLRAVIPAIQNSVNGEAFALASRTAEKSKQIADKLGIPKAFGNYNDLIVDTDVEAIYIPLPNSFHTIWAIQAIEHGKHVLCEKPLAVTPAEIDAIKATTYKNDIIVMEAIMYHFHPLTKRVIEIVRSGQIGTPQLVMSAFNYNVPNPEDIRLQSALGGGVLFDVGTYCVSVARNVFGKEPIHAIGSARFGLASNVDEVFTGILTFEDGSQSCFGCCLHGPRDQWYRIIGTEAVLSVSMPFAPGIDDRSIIIRRGWQRGKETEEKIVIPGVDQYQLMVEHFNECIISGITPIISLEESRANMVVVDALLRSAKEGIPIRFEEKH